MAKLVDALDLGSCGATRKSSSLFTRTTLRQGFGWQATLSFVLWALGGRPYFFRVCDAVDKKTLDLSKKNDKIPYAMKNKGYQNGI